MCLIVIWLSILRIRCEALGCEKHGACDAYNCACEVWRLGLRSAETGLAKHKNWACEVRRMGLCAK